MSQITIGYVDVSALSPIEGFSRKRVLWLKDKVLEEGVWTTPIKVEKSKLLIMDGHHRFEVSKALGLSRIPVHFFSYDEVQVWSLRDNHEVSSEIILRNHEEGVIFPYKTAKHKFPEGIEAFQGVRLEDLY